MPKGGGYDESECESQDRSRSGSGLEMSRQNESGKCGERRITKRSSERCGLQMSLRSRSLRLLGVSLSKQA